ncbi:MAG: hypothetical protein J5607_02350 [Clostridiales bacterium]|nr:hypothetical protein [Clostridiales bacterium]
MNKFAVCGAVLSLITLVGVAGLKSAKTNGAGVVSDNVAGSYVDYDTETYIDWSTGGAILQNKFMYKYTTSSTKVTDGTSQKYVYSYQGPTTQEFTLTYQSGISRSTSVTASAEYKIFKLAASHTITDSKSVSVSVKTTFPGDKKLHTLYQTDHTIGWRGKISRLAYRATVKSYDYIWGVCYWNVQYNDYARYSSYDWGTRDCCDTVEHQYGTKLV